MEPFSKPQHCSETQQILAAQILTSLCASVRRDSRVSTLSQTTNHSSQDFCKSLRKFAQRPTNRVSLCAFPTNRVRASLRISNKSRECVCACVSAHCVRACVSVQSRECVRACVSARVCVRVCVSAHFQQIIAAKIFASLYAFPTNHCSQDFCKSLCKFAQRL